jgi:hypothetical protein
MGNLSNGYKIESIIASKIKKIVNDYHLKSCIFAMVDYLWITGSNTRKQKKKERVKNRPFFKTT